MLTFYGYVGAKVKYIHPCRKNIEKTLSDNGRFKCHCYIGQDFFIAYADYKNQPQLPVTDQAGQVYALATGHLYEWADGSSNSSEKQLSQEVLSVYLEKGIAGLQGCRGNYSIVIIDRRYEMPGKVFLLKDRLGYSPLYYYADENGISFASRAESIGVSRIYEPILDNDAMAHALYLGIVLEGKSLFANVVNLSGGQLLTYHRGRNLINSYVDPMPWPERPAAHYLDCVDDLAESVNNAVERQGRYCKKPIKLFLSGGTESRLLLSCLLKRGQDFHAVTQYDLAPDNNPDILATKRLEELLGFKLMIEKSNTLDAEVAAGMLGEIISDEENEVHTVVGHGWTTSGDRWNKPVEVKNMAETERAFGRIVPFTTQFLDKLTFDLKEISAKYIEQRCGINWEQKAYGHNMDVYCSTFLRNTETDTHARPQNRFLGNLHLPYLDEDTVIATAKIPPMLPSIKIKLFEELFRRYFPKQLKVQLVHKYESKKHQALTTRVGDNERYTGKEVEFPYRRLHVVYETAARKILADPANGLLGQVISETCLEAEYFPIHFSLGIIFWEAWRKRYFSVF